MRTVVAAVLLSLLSSVAPPASVLADPSPSPSPSPITDDCARARRAGKACVLDVPAEDVDGRTATAGDASTRVLVFRPEGSLLRLRRDFLPEIVKTAEDL